jgi:outer membrane protein OmpA-like peptidoglycan-associated protein
VHLLLGFVSFVVLALPLTAGASKCAEVMEIRFAPRIAAISTQDKERIADAIERLERTSRVLLVLPVGHADTSDFPDKSKADVLSLERARSIRDYLARVRPDLASLINIEGKGLNQPAAKLGDRRNRRVDLEIICPANWQPWRTQ